MNIYINNQRAVLKQGTSFEVVSENRLFTGSDSYSLTITFPLRGCQTNIDIFGNICRPDVDLSKMIFDCEIRDRAFVKFGCITITGIDDAEVKAQFLEGRSETNFDSTFDDIYINELDLGEPTILDPSVITPMNAWQSGFYDISYVALPWVNNESGNIQNCADYKDGSYVWSDNTKGLSWQPYLLHIAVAICKAVGYSFDFDAWANKEELRYLLVCNTLPWAWDMPGFADALPHWTVTEFFEKLELFLAGEFDIDHRAKMVTFFLTDSYLQSLPVVPLDKVVDEFEAEVTAEDESVDYLGAKNLVYSECDHEMWKFYSCDWFFKLPYVKNSLITYPTLTKALDALKPFASWNGSSHRGDKSYCVFYAQDVDIYFVVRAVSKTLVKENEKLPNVYKYKCVLQPINMFGGHIVDPGEDAEEQEIEFVPAWIDETDDTYGRCLFLDFDGYDDNDTSGTTFIGGMDAFKEQVDSTLYQPLPVQMLSNGESDGKTEYYDKIYLAWWDGAAPYTGKLPFPYVDSVIIDDDWSGYRMPHCNLRINDRTSSLNRAYTAINAKKKITFKFLADELPNPRSTFLIRGKRYICEKITATFTENGMSQLLKGVFYEIAY